MMESKVKVHIIKEVLKNLSGAATFPVAEMRAERGLRGQHFDVPGAIPDPSDNRDAEEPPKQTTPTSYLRRKRFPLGPTSVG